MSSLYSYQLTQSFPEESVSFYEEIFPGFTLIRNKIVRCNYFQLWKYKYLIRKKSPKSDDERKNQCKYLKLFIENFQNRLTLQVYFGRWKRMSQMEQLNSNQNLIDPKYVEFMTELQESISNQANLKTTISVLDKKIDEVSEVERETRNKADGLQRKCDIMMSTYENLLRQLSEMKINHRDHVSSLQLQIGKAISSQESDIQYSYSNVLNSIAQDQSRLLSEKEKIHNLIQKEKEKAAELRSKIDLCKNDNIAKEKEIDDLKNEINAFPDPESDPYVEPNSKLVELHKILIQADQQLQQTSVLFQKQSAQIKELDFQINKHKATLDDLKRKQKSITAKSIQRLSMMSRKMTSE
ncbi:hypothetical protein M9Y10_004354 [Tritrichomonas musculus]|uniref:Uncharacterized protein n=1 Tax=Tritrichomonas musculus TaxID=1915356 RepID=A0ABR2JRR3_9EUKA